MVNDVLAQPIADTQVEGVPSRKYDGLLEDRLRQLEAELNQKHNHAVLMGKLLHEAKYSISHLGEEADLECQKLRTELASKQHELYALMRSHDAFRSSIASLEMHSVALNEEALELRNDAEVSSARQAETYAEMIANAALLQNSAEQETSRWVVIEQAEMHACSIALAASSSARDEEAIFRARVDALENSLRRHMSSEAIIEDAAAKEKFILREEIERFQNELSAESTLAKSRQDAATASCAIHANETLEAAQKYQDIEAAFAQLQSEHNDARNAIDNQSQEAMAREDHLRNAESELASTTAALTILSNKSEQESNTYEAELQVLQARLVGIHPEMGPHKRDVKSQSERINGELAAASECMPIGAASVTDLRWSRLALMVERRETERRFRRGRACWSAGCGKMRLTTTRLAEQLQSLAASKNKPGKTTSRYQQGVRRLGASPTKESCHVEQVAARATAAANVAWSDQVQELRRELEHARAALHETKAEFTHSNVHTAADHGVSVEVASACQEGPMQMKPPGRTSVKSKATLRATVSNRADHCHANGDRGEKAGLEMRLQEENKEVQRLRQELADAQEVIGKLVAGGGAEVDALMNG
eukprot:TRINITY_DN55382_c0_g1_i1.p1 TRINITY_DN55382_c0_g1~~TRINITY_DN55382_c0_g1_i1.p1  ORF type:complete len:596 (-),score=81.48 TRINITY_DN55382_c0_g1_i1:21-1808(-)